MKNSASIDLYNNFEDKINDFKKNPKSYKFKLKSRLLRQFYNSLSGFLLWAIMAILFNLIGIYFFNISLNKSDSASMFALLSLFFTIAARNYTVNYILFDSLGNIGKNYLLHELANRIGFFHRFMALSTIAWFFVHLNYTNYDSSIALFILISLFIITISAFAILRRKFHNSFEIIHRYLGYLSISLLVYYYFQINFNQGLSISEIITKADFFILFAIIVLLISPWIGVKRIEPELVHTGPHVIGMKIQGKPSFGTYSRITLGTYCYHPFGDSMIDFNDMENRTLYMTPAGDRTSDIVYSANKGNFILPKCTIRKNRNKGFMYHHSIFDHILIVVTGGGIAPIIPCLVLNKKTKIDVLWIGRSQSEEFTDELLGNLLNKISDQEIGIHILDTTQDDLKNLTNENYAALALSAYEHYKPEAVFIMSNQNFTIDLVYMFKENDIKVYGATFDS